MNTRKNFKPNRSILVLYYTWIVYGPITALTVCTNRKDRGADLTVRISLCILEKRIIKNVQRNTAQKAIVSYIYVIELA